MIISSIILTLMFLLFCVGLGVIKPGKPNGLIRLWRCSHELKSIADPIDKHVASSIQKMFVIKPNLSNDVSDNEVSESSTSEISTNKNPRYYIDNLFSDELLKKQFTDYIDAVSESIIEPDKNDELYPDIKEYFNHHLLERICNADMCDFIPGSLTALGILGTFIGLIIGLSSLNVRVPNELLNDIQTLINGLKTAFFTSIAGIITSLIFGMLYRKAMQAAEENLILFTERISRLVIKQNESKFTNRLQSTLESLSNFSQDVTDAITNPMLEMKNALLDYNKYATQTQISAINKVAELVMQRVNTSLGHNIQDLSQALSSSTKDASEYSQELHSISDNLNTISERISQVSNDYIQIVNRLQVIDQKLSSIDTSYNNNIASLTKVSVAAEQFLKDLQKSQTSFLKEISERSNEQIMNFSDSECEAIDKLQSSITDTIQTFDATNNTFISNLTSHYAGLTDQLSAASESASVLLNSIMKQNDTYYNDAMNCIHQMHENTEKMSNESNFKYEEYISASYKLQKTYLDLLENTYKDATKQLLSLFQERINDVGFTEDIAQDLHEIKKNTQKSSMIKLVKDLLIKRE